MKYRRFLQLIHIHPILIFFIVISIVTGTFIQLFTMLCIVFVHEIGHYVAASYYRWRIRSIMMWVFGGVMKTDESTNRPIKEDVIVTLAGPLQHILIFIFLVILSTFTTVNDSIISFAHYSNFFILIFNLLPIYPLDGGKLMLYLLSSLFSFRKAHRTTVSFSILACVCIVLLQVVVFPFTLSAFLLMVFLLLENRVEWKNHYYTFIRFLFNRMELDHPQWKSEQLNVPDHYRLIDAFSLFRRNRTHRIHVVGKKQSLSEKESLHLYFNDQKYHETMNDIIDS